MIKIHTLLLTVLLCFGGVSVGIAQETKKVENVKGKAYFREDKSPAEAQKEAFQKAKENALRKAGLAEYIRSWKWQRTSQTNDSLSQSFLDAINSEIRGGITDTNLKKTNKYYNEKLKTWVYEVIIDATVKKYESKTDPNFNVEIKGVKNVYTEGEPLRIMIKTSKPSYLTLINLVGDTSLLMYPHKREKPKRFKPQTKYSLPLPSSPFKKYYVSLPEGVNKQTNMLLFIFTKHEPIKFVSTKGRTGDEWYNPKIIGSDEKVFQQIHEIPPHKRRIKVKHFKIFGKRY